MDLSYCTNVHPAEDLDGVLAPARRLRRPGAARGRPRRARRRPLAARRPRRTARGERRRPGSPARHGSTRTGSMLRTINAFPYRAFHAEVVKLDVYRPDWTDPRRVAAHARLRGGARRPAARGRGRQHLDAPARLARAVDGRRRPAATAALAAVSRRLRALRDAHRPHGSRWRSSPNRVACSTRWHDVVGWLARAHRRSATTPSTPSSSASASTPATSPCRSPTRPTPCAEIAEAGLRVVKVQASAALHVERPSDPASRDAVGRVRRAALPAPDARAGGPTARCCAADDLPEAARDAADGWPVAGALPRAAASRAARAAHRHDRRARGRPRRRPRAAARRRGPPRRRDLHLDRAARTPSTTSSPASRASSAGRRSTCSARAEPVLAASVPVESVHRGGGVMTSTLLLDVVGLTPRTLAHMPRLRALAASGARARLGTVLPAVTCSVQSTMLTGLAPAQHGIVGNGWYFRDLGEVHLWRQHNAARAGREGVGDGPARAARLHRRERRLVVRDGREHRHHRDAATDLPRRRPQVARRLRAPARPARRADRRARRVPALPVLGADRVDRVEPLDRRGDPHGHARAALRPRDGVPAAPRLRPAALRARVARRPTGPPPSSTRRWRRCSTTPRPRVSP